MKKKTRARKRTRNEGTWKSNKRKTRRQSGNEYVGVSGKPAPARRVLPHHSDCRFECILKFDDAQGQYVHDDFWKLTDLEKRHFYARTTKQFPKRRTRLNRSTRTNKVRHKVNTYEYYFMTNTTMERVCKSFYLNTLNICQSRVVSYHLSKDSVTGKLQPSKQGKHRKHKLADTHRKAVIDHINSFPRVQSHYCRSRTQKEYLDDGLSIARMYNLFVEMRLAKQPDVNDGDTEYIEPVRKYM